MTPSLDELDEIEQELDFLESIIQEIKDARLAPLRAVVHIDSDMQAFIYVASNGGVDDGSLQVRTKQDADFVCESILIIGDNQATRTRSNHSAPSAVAISITPMDGASLTNGTSAPTTNNIPTAYSRAQTQSQLLTPFPQVTIPVDVFVPTIAGDVSGTGDDSSEVPNVDYWHTLAAEWVIPKGQPLLLQARYDVVNDPLTVLSQFTPGACFVGYKVAP